MRAFIRRLQRLEETFMPTADYQSPPWVYILMERQRRRAEANGVPYEEPWRTHPRRAR